MKKEMEIAEEIFGTQNDPEQILINMDSLAKLRILSKNAIQTKLNDAGEPISWVVVIPTSKVLAEKFLAKDINERQLFEQTQPMEMYEALYICSAITLPEYRSKGYATELFKGAIDKIPHVDDVMILSWPTTPEGKGLASKAIKKYGLKMSIRE